MVSAMLRIVVLALLLSACAKEEPRRDPAAAADPAPVPEVTVDELAALIERGGHAVDANNAATRERQGVIPGATILSHFQRYDLGELPADRAAPLVFYCANEQCGASHAAAERARLAGWTDVRVLPAGIAGWRNAGRSTSRL